MAYQITMRQLPRYWTLYLFVLPSALLVGTFAYFPAFSAMFHAFYRWNGDYINNYVGLLNFTKALGNPLLWVLEVGAIVSLIQSAGKTGVFAKALKLIAGIGVPLVGVGVMLMLSRAASSPLSLYAKPEGHLGLGLALGFWGLALALVLFVLNRESDQRQALLLVIVFLGGGGILSSLGLLSVFAWSLTALLTNLYTWFAPAIRSHRRVEGLRLLAAFAAQFIMLWTLASFAGGDRMLWSGFGVICILVAANIVKMVPSVFTAVLIHRLKSETAGYWYRVFFVIPMIIPGMVYLLIWKFFFDPTRVFNQVLNATGIMKVLGWLDGLLGWGGHFIASVPGEVVQPVWLGNPDLVLPAFILWGFPWVGTVGVLIYLAGLQSIDTSVYEAADLDGVGWFGKFLYIELPLIMTQVRINLVLMIIGTLQTYGFVLVLLGDGGGPQGKMMVPGLYMFRQAFVEGYAGYACCIGLILFVLILLLTEINNRFLRVEK